LRNTWSLPQPASHGFQSEEKRSTKTHEEEQACGRSSCDFVDRFCRTLFDPGGMVKRVYDVSSAALFSSIATTQSGITGLTLNFPGMHPCTDCIEQPGLQVATALP
jgi:hypothetical protein